MTGHYDLDGPSLRQVRLAGREAIKQARDATRAVSRQARAELREVITAARDAEQAAAARTGRDGESGEASTRARIQAIALDLFTEHGYEATSLREIAERLGVTKAALYYHFKTKDDIIASAVDDCGRQIEELIAWAQEQPRGIETRMEFLRRYSELLHNGDNLKLMRCFERNQPAMHQHKAGSMMRDRMTRMLDLMSDRGDPLDVQIRRSMAVFALHSAWFVLRDREAPEDQRRVAALEVALTLVD